MSPFLKDHPPQQPVALELVQVSLSSSSMEFSYSFVKSKVPNSELRDITMEWNFKTIFKYMGNPRLLLTPIFLLLLIILDISDPPSQYLVNPWNPCAEKQGDDNFSSAFNYWSPTIKETASNDKGRAYWDVQSRRLPVCHCSQGNQIAFLTKLDFGITPFVLVQWQGMICEDSVLTQYVFENIMASCFQWRWSQNIRLRLLLTFPNIISNYCPLINL